MPTKEQQLQELRYEVNELTAAFSKVMHDLSELQVEDKPRVVNDYIATLPTEEVISFIAATMAGEKLQDVFMKELHGRRDSSEVFIALFKKKQQRMESGNGLHEGV